MMLLNIGRAQGTQRFGPSITPCSVSDFHQDNALNLHKTILLSFWRSHTSQRVQSDQYSILLSYMGLSLTPLPPACVAPHSHSTLDII